MSGLVDALFGGGDSTTTNNVTTTTAAPSAEELALIKLNTELAQKQLDNINLLAPFQKSILDYTLQSIESQKAADKKWGEFSDEEMARARKLGPIQDELLNLQLDALRRNGAATPEQIQSIKDATEASIAAGTSDIDVSTQRGIGLISDELANSRGLRLSDSPIMHEAGFLVRSGEDQKASLIKNLRAGEMTARLNLPLAVQQLQSGVNMGQQNLIQSTQNFQAQLREQAAANRMSLFGQTMSGGIGLASVGSGVGSSTLGSLSSLRGRSQSGSGSSFDPVGLIGAYGQLAGGIGGMMKGFSSDRRLKQDIVRVGALPSGLPIYRFRYLGEKEQFVGVMADEAVKLFPAAVSMDEDGYQIVDYSRLG